MTNQSRGVAIALVALAAVALGCTAPSAADAPSAPGTAAPASPAASASPAAGSPMPRPASSVPMDVPSRVVIGDLGIDLPVVSGDTSLPGNPPDYPLCDVAQYLTTYRYPGRPGTTTWIYGHARDGMFLALLEASERDDGAELIGRRVDVYSTAGRRYTYEMTDVLRHATDRSAATGVPPTTGRLILQTSEGPRGTIPKLQVVAELAATTDAPATDAMPSASPRVCHGE